MGDLKFVPLSLLENWSDLGKIEMDGATLRLPAESASFALTPAVRFLSVVEGEDTNALVAKVKTEEFLKGLGGEVVGDSCLVGETAYQVQPGFLAEGAALAAAQASKATRQPAAPRERTLPAAGRPPVPAPPGSAPAVQNPYRSAMPAPGPARQPPPVRPPAPIPGAATPRPPARPLAAAPAPRAAVLRPAPIGPGDADPGEKTVPFPHAPGSSPAKP